MSCNENTYIEDISLHLILFDLLGWSVIARRQLFWVRLACNENTYIEVISLHLNALDLFGLAVIAHRQLFWVKSPCNENTYIEVISLHLSSADLFGSPRIVCLMAISEWMRYGPVLKSTHGVVVRSRSNLILNEIAHMSCNENTYIEDISLHLILFDLLGLSVIACRQLFLVKFSCNENTYIEVISLQISRSSCWDQMSWFDFSQ
jgi:hypothetical protein